jgi:transcriptional regulator with XRE-family HTH domain
MQATLSEQEMGARIAALRTMRGYTQEELAVLIGVSRPVLTQMESGNRRITVQDLVALAGVLGFSLDDFVAKEFRLLDSIDGVQEAAPEVTIERIAVPALQIHKFKQVLLYLLERCAGKANVGETVLYKLLYFSDFNYYERYEEHLTGAAYRKLPYGPVPQQVDAILAQMEEEGQIQRVKVRYFDKPQTRFLPLVAPDLTALNGAEKEVIDRVVDQMGDWSATAISQYSHRDLPWQASGEGDVISYELAFYREAPYSVRVYNEEQG